MPPFTRKVLATASSKRPICPHQSRTLLTRYNVALQDVLVGDSSPSSKVDLATLYGFMCAASELNVIDDGGVISGSLPGFAQAFRRAEAGQAFRLDARAAETIKEMIGGFEEIVTGVNERTFMLICNRVQLNVEQAR